MAEHDVLGDAGDGVGLGKGRGLEQNVDRLLEGGAHQCAGLDAVDAVARDGHQVAAVGHDVAQDGEVAVVDVRAVERDDVAHLLEQRGACGLDAEHAVDLDDVVRDGARGVNVGRSEHGEQVRAVGVEHPLDALVARRRLELLLAHVDLAHVAYAEQLERVEQALLAGAQKDAVRLRVLGLGVGVAVDEPNAQHEVLGVVVVEEALQLVLALLGLEEAHDALVDVGHLEVLVEHELLVEMHAQQPRRQRVRVGLVGRVVVRAHKLLVLVDDGGRGIGVVPDLGGARNVSQRRVAELALHGLGLVLVARVVLVEEHDHARRLDRVGDVDELLETRHAERDVLARDAGVVKGVERHLRGRLADRLRRDGADHLAGLRARRQEATANLADEPIERHGVEAMLDDRALGGERRAQMDGEQQRGVLLHAAREGVVAAHDDEAALEQRVDLLDDGARMEVGRLARVNVELLLRVPDEALERHRQRAARLAARENVVPQRVAVVEQLLVLALEQRAVLGAALDRLDDARLHDAAAKVAALDREAEAALHLGVGHFEELELLRLDRRRVHAVLAVQELNHVAERVAHRAVVLHHDVLHGLDEPTLNVAGLGGLDRRVDETLATAHGVEEELLRREAREVRVGHEAAALGQQVVLVKVRQRAVAEAVRHTLALDVLLSDARNDLRNVDERALGAGRHHGLDVVRHADRELGRLAGAVASAVQRLVDAALERLHHRTTGLERQLVLLRLNHIPPHLLLGLGETLVDLLHGGVVGDRVADADRVATRQEPAVDNVLRLVQEALRLLGPVVVPNNVHQATGRLAE